MSFISLQNRLKRMDGGISGRVEDISDAQLLRLIARGQPDPAAFLAMPAVDQDRVIDEICREAGLLALQTSAPGATSTHVPRPRSVRSSRQ